MADFYVKSGGVWAAPPGSPTIYDSVRDAINTGGATSGDTIYASHLHNKDFGGLGNQTWAGPTNEGLAPLRVISVDDADAATPRPGAREGATSGVDDLSLSGIGYLYGFTIVSDDDFIHPAVSKWELDECTYEGTTRTGTSTGTIVVTGGPFIRWRDLTLVPGSLSTAPLFNLGTGAFVELHGFSHTSGGRQWGAAGSIFVQIQNGGGVFRAYGVDLSAADTAFDIVSNTGTLSSEGGDICLYGVRLPTGWTGNFISGGGFTGYVHRRVEIIGADDADDFIYFYADGPRGTVNVETTIYKTTPTKGTLPSGQRFSFKVDTTSDCRPDSPFRWYLPSQYIDLANASSDTIKLHLTTDLAITTEHIALFVAYQDATTGPMLAFDSTGPKYAAHPNASGWMHDPVAGSYAALTSETGIWTGAKANQRSLSLTISGAKASSNLAPVVWLEIYTNTGATPIYVDTELETS